MYVLLHFLRDHVVGLGVDLLGVGVLEPQDQVPSVPLDVLVVQDGHPCVADVQRAGRTGRDAHDDPPLNVLELRELVVALLLLLDQHRGVHLAQGLRLRLQTHGVDLLHDLVDQRCDLGGLGPELGASPEDLPDDGLGVGLAFEEDGVLKSEFPDRILDLVGHECSSRTPILHIRVCVHKAHDERIGMMFQSIPMRDGLFDCSFIIIQYLQKSFFY